MNKQDKQTIAPRFNDKLKNTLNGFSDKFNTPASDLKIVITPKRELSNNSLFAYSVYGKQGKLCDADFNEIVHLNALEVLAINKKTIEEYIIDSLVKFSIGAVCDINSLYVMIFFDANGGIKIALVKDSNIINYFTVDKLF